MKTDYKEILVIWRERNRLTREQVEVLLDYPTGTLSIFESRGFAQIPARELIKIVFLYKIPMDEFLKVTELYRKKSP